MTEKLFASLSEYGMNLSTLTGASGSLGNLKAVGTQWKDGTSGKRVLEYNYVNLLTHSGTDHSSRRGMNIAIFDNNMALTYMATFDLYADQNALVSFIDRMRSIKPTELVILTSCDAIGSSDDIDELFKSYRSVSWPGKSYFSKGTNYSRSSYVGVFCGKKQHIVGEKFVGGGSPESDAIIDMSFSDPTTIGFSGYGPLLVFDENITESTGVTNVVKTWINQKSLSELSLKPADTFMLQGLAEINNIANMTNTYLEFRIIYYDKSKKEITSVTKPIKSVEGWEMVEIRDSIAFGCEYLTVQAIATQKDNSPGGKVYVKNVVMQTSDNEYVETNNISIGLYGTAAKRYEDSLGNFGHYDPDGYHRAYNASDNILKGLTMKQNSNEPVEWFNRTLDKNNERVATSTSSQYSSEIGKFAIDPKKWYYCCVWTNKQQKQKGTLGLRLEVSNVAGTTLELTSTDYQTTSNNMYSQRPEFDMLEDRQWYLMQGFILPTGVDATRAEEFIERNCEFYGWDDLYGNGIGISDSGDGNFGWINNKDAVNGKLYFIDEDNDGDLSKSLWALPILKELTIGSIDIDDGLLTSMSLGS
ncbi:MAG: interleukin-like EMT inducer domain-containing protein [Bacilli bacterium]